LVVNKGIFRWQFVDELIEFASAQNYANGTPVEGIVIRPVQESHSKILKGRMAFTPRYSLKYKNQ
jgi:hypothetical protein